MTTDPGDLVLDPTCGSGTTALCAEKLGRRWITIDTSRVALAIARERLLTAKFDYYRLQDAARGYRRRPRYETLTRVTASSIGYGADPETETLYDQPKVDRSKVRVSGPFTVEGLSRYSTDPLSANGDESSSAEDAADHVEVLLDALRTQGIPRQNGKPAEVVSLTPIAGAGDPPRRGHLPRLRRLRGAVRGLARPAPRPDHAEPGRRGARRGARATS